jgi:SAM-dependent methyltransferase/GNAT superfamily N-acetyltransferase
MARPLPERAPLPLRALRIFRQEGARGVGIRLLGATVYRRLVVMHRSLDDPRAAIAADLPVTVELLGDRDVDDYVQLCPWASAAAIRGRLRRGLRCFVARHEGRIVHAGWTTTSGAWIEYLGGEMPLAPGDVYQFESYTAAPLRGRGIAAARVSAMADQLAREGHRRLIACVLPENAAAFRPLEKAGYRAVGQISAIGGGPWRRLRLRHAASPTDYWGQVHRRTQTGSSIPVWRAYMRHVYADVIHRWLPESSPGMALKTDLFEEAVGPHEPFSELGPRAVGVDLAPAIVKAACERLASAGGKQHFVVGDLRQIPLRSGSITRIFSGSSLDHFADKADISRSLTELVRVLAPGGVLALALDNPQNPVVWLRNHLPFRWLNRLGLVPYYVGDTYGRTEARIQLEALGLTVTHTAALAHAPRLPAIWLAMVAERFDQRRLAGWLARALSACERLDRLPTRYRTAYYLALRAEKPAAGPPRLDPSGKRV